jgi:hypothetical protein
MLLAAAVSCGSGGGTVGGKPLPDPCAVLTLDDVRAIVPDAEAGTNTNDAQVPHVETRGCHSKRASSQIEGIELHLFRALDADGRTQLEVAVSSIGSSGTPIAGLGDQARYWDDLDGTTKGVVARKGDAAAGLTSYFINSVTQDALVAAMRKVVGAI